MIVCPNHHSIIHDTNPIFDRKRMMYLFRKWCRGKVSAQ